MYLPLLLHTGCWPLRLFAVTIGFLLCLMSCYRHCSRPCPAPAVGHATKAQRSGSLGLFNETFLLIIWNIVLLRRDGEWLIDAGTGNQSGCQCYNSRLSASPAWSSPTKLPSLGLISLQATWPSPSSKSCSSTWKTNIWERGHYFGFA